MRSALMILGILCVLMGLLWVGQGFGIIHWPASSFMIDERPWAPRGAILSVVGIALLIVATRKR
jgi:uncharacterized membrane protein YidH (DUF202 family)